jgi:tetratricopeptide (TPR) repeat protein
VCVRCGVNLLTGHQVAQRHEDGSAPPASKAPYLAGALVVVVLALAGALGFVLLQDPVKSARQKARTGDTLGAINTLQKHTDSAEDDVEAFAMLGRLYWQAQQFENASTAFETASRLRPADEELGFMAVLAAGKVAGAAGSSRQLSALKRMENSHPGNTRVQKMLALALGTAGEYAASDASLSRWASLSGDEGEASAYRGVVHAMKGDFDAARQSLDEAGAAVDAARLAQGYLASLEGEPDQARAVLSEVAVGGGASNKNALTRLALLYMASGEFDRALPLLSPVQGTPSGDASKFFYALCMQTAGLGNEALLEYERLVSSGGPFAADSAVQMAIVYIEQSQLERASESMRKARKFGNSSRMYTVEGQIASTQGDLAVAQENYRKAIQEDNNYPAAHLEHGLVYVRRGALAEGVRELERYLELADPNVPKGRINEVELLVKQLRQALNRGES